MGSLCWFGIACILLGVIIPSSLAFIGAGFASSKRCNEGKRLNHVAGLGSSHQLSPVVSRIVQSSSHASSRSSLTSLRMNDEAHYYGEGSEGGKQGGGAKRKPRPPPRKQTSSSNNGGSGRGGGRADNRGRGGGGGRGGGVPQRDMAQLIERSGADGPEWKRAVNYDDLAGPPGRGRDRPPGSYRGGGGGRGGGRGRGGRAPPIKKSWWTSEFNKMDGELDIPLPWWATKVEMDYEDMKVPELKAELQRRNAKVSGTKQELIDRLTELDKHFSLSDDGFREAVVIDDSKARLPACFPEQYGDEYEMSLLKQDGKKTVDTHQHHVHGSSDELGKSGMKFPYQPEG